MKASRNLKQRREPARPAPTPPAAECGCLIGTIHAYRCASVGHVDGPKFPHPTPPAVPSKLEAVSEVVRRWRTGREAQSIGLVRVLLDEIDGALLVTPPALRAAEAERDDALRRLAEMRELADGADLMLDNGQIVAAVPAEPLRAILDTPTGDDLPGGGR